MNICTWNYHGRCSFNMYENKKCVLLKGEKCDVEYACEPCDDQYEAQYNDQYKDHYKELKTG